MTPDEYRFLKEFEGLLPWNSLMNAWVKAKHYKESLDKFEDFQLMSIASTASVSTKAVNSTMIDLRNNVAKKKTAFSDLFIYRELECPRTKKLDIRRIQRELLNG